MPKTQKEYYVFQDIICTQFVKVTAASKIEALEMAGGVDGWEEFDGSPISGELTVEPASDFE